MEDLYQQIDAKHKELLSLTPISTTNEERLWKKFRLEWNYNSNHLEGNTLTYQETELMLIFDQAPNGKHTVREIEEMKAHDVVVLMIRQWASDAARLLTESDIRTLNEKLLVRPFWKEALTQDGQQTRRLIKVGEYKEFPNSVHLPTGEMFHYADPQEVPARMHALMEWYRKASETDHPLWVAAKFHYDFVRIHPFDDGNGRLARLLMNYHLLRTDFPPAIIKSANKKSYLAALNRADVGDFEAFVQYIGEQLLWSLDLSIRAAKGENIEEAGDWGKEIEILKREAEGRKISKSIQGDQQKHLVEVWLTRNVPVLRAEMEKYFNPFHVFFKSAEIKARLHDRPELPETWDGIARKIVDLLQVIKLEILFNGQEFLYHNLTFFNLNSRGMDVAFDRDQLTLFYSWPEKSKTIPYSKDLDSNDLAPIREMAEAFRAIIEAAIKA